MEDWTPEPLVAKATAFEEADIEKRPVIVGSEILRFSRSRVDFFFFPSDILVALPALAQSSPTGERSRTSHPTTTTTSSRTRTSKSAPFRPSAPTAWGPVAPPASTARRMST